VHTATGWAIGDRIAAVLDSHPSSLVHGCGAFTPNPTSGVLVAPRFARTILAACSEMLRGIRQLSRGHEQLPLGRSEYGNPVPLLCHVVSTLTRALRYCIDLALRPQRSMPAIAKRASRRVFSPAEHWRSCLGLISRVRSQHAICSVVAAARLRTRRATRRHGSCLLCEVPLISTTRIWR
jgi:hypothetical protein